MTLSTPIGIFDSGIGGLSVLLHLRQLLPNENFFYIADSGFAPYGNKPIEDVVNRCKYLTNYMLNELQVKAIVVACNTATAAAVHELRQISPVPVIAMEPGVKPAIAATRNKTVGVLATQNTLVSEQFAALVHRYADDVTLVSQACHGLVEQIETGELDSNKTREILRQYMDPLLAANVDTIVLGCTHYPLIKSIISDMAGPGITLIDTGEAVARQVEKVLQGLHNIAANSQAGESTFVTSGDPVTASSIVSNILGQSFSVKSLPA